MMASPMDDCEVSGSIYLVAVPRELMPPVFYGNGLLQRMRAVLLPHDTPPAVEMADYAVNIPFEDFSSPFGTQPARIPPFRPVHGEILRDQEGHLYERNGSSIRRLGSLSSSRYGELLEAPATRTLNGEQGTRQAAPGKGFHQFFRDPGESRILCWGEYKSLLKDQVARPERLRDNHRLACFVQVYENFVSRTPEAFARECFGDIRVAGQLFELTEALAERLKLLALLPAQPPRNCESSDGLLREGDRILQLKLVADPTSETTAAATPAPEANGGPATTPGSPANPAPSASLKTSIPDRFLTPWESLSTREQVLSEMSQQPSETGRLRRWTSSILRSGEMKRWRRQLWGKTADEQLWGVRPPKGSLRGGEVVDWARAMLAAAGYDPSMLREWEIFWRQKGL